MNDGMKDGMHESGSGTTAPGRDLDLVRAIDPDGWAEAVGAARREGFVHFDWLGCVDDLDRSETFTVVVRLVRPEPVWSGLRMFTSVPRSSPQLPSIAALYPGAGWHEREGADLFGIDFVGGDTEPLLLAGHDGTPPLRKDDVLAARAATPWPGAKDPADSGAGVGAGPSPAGPDASPGRRRTLPVGVPEPEVWGDRVDPEPADPAEVARSLSGGRVRRRRP